MTQAPPGRYLTREATSPPATTRAPLSPDQGFQTDVQPDIDAFDAKARHFLVEERASGALVCCFRLSLFYGAALRQSYGAIL